MISNTYEDIAYLEESAMQDETRGWETPIPLDVSNGPPLALDALPPVMRDTVGAVARQVQAPPDLAFVAGLGAFSAAVGGKFVVTPDGEWQEPVHIMAIGIAPPSTGKSPIFAAITRPLADWQDTNAAQVAPQVASWESERRILERQLGAAEKERGAVSRDGRTTDGAAVWQAAMAELETHRHRKPIMPLAFVSDATPEQAARLLHEQDGALSILSPESPFLSNTIGGRYSDSPNVDLILNGYSGERIDRHRVGGDGFTVPRACLTLAVMVQPSVISALGKVPETTGRGVSSRLLPVIPASMIGTRTYANRVAIPSEAITAWHDTITRLLNIHREGEPLVLTLSRDAELIFSQFWDNVERRILVDGNDMAEWRGKLRGQVLRIAGLFHVAEYSHPETLKITANTLLSAIEVGEYFEAHALVMFAMMAGRTGSNSKARQVLDAILAITATRGALTKREVFRKLQDRTAFGTADELDNPLAQLEEYGYIRLGRAGKSIPIELNPLIHPDNANKGVQEMECGGSLSVLAGFPGIVQ